MERKKRGRTGTSEAEAELIPVEPAPDDAFMYICPECHREGHKPSLIKHRPTCSRFKKRST